MRKITRLLGLMLSVIMILTAITVPVSAYYNVTMYAPDGRTIVVDNYDVWAWKNVGWYEYPVVTMYAPDGRSMVVAETDVAIWSNVGWIDGRLTTLIYSADGRTATIPAWQLQMYLNVGWYEYPAEVLDTYYDGTSIPKYDYTVDAYYLDSYSKYTSDGTGIFYNYSYSSTLSSKQEYVDYLQTIGWEYYDSEILDDYSVWYMTYGEQLVGIYFYFGEDIVEISYIV